MTADSTHVHSNFFENKYPYPERITALSDQDAKWMEKRYKGLKFVQGDGCCLPFKNNSFDLVFSSAVLEHVGDRERQKQFLAECVRVSSRYVFLTTPNRWYPFEFHSALPFVHWLPQKYFFMILRLLGKKSLADRNVLNLCSSSDIVRFLTSCHVNNFKIYYSYFMGFPANIIVFIDKQQS